MSPGLALFLYGVSSIPGEGTFFAKKVAIPATIGLLHDHRVRVPQLPAEAPAA